jgi:hypothetical protein
MDQQKSFLKRFWWIWIITGVGLAVVCFIVISSNSHYQQSDYQKQGIKDQGNEDQFNWPSANAKYITSVPVDLTQIISITKYRGCTGHDRSGYSFEQILETDRSMKHALSPTATSLNTTDQIKLYAPFDGTVTSFTQNDQKFAGRINGSISFSTPVDTNVILLFGHINSIREFIVGDSVQSGELIGYAALYENGGFDIDLTAKSYFSQNGKKTDIEVLGSIFDHMTDDVLTEFAKYGLTPENTKITKEFRDAHPCNYPKPSTASINESIIRLMGNETDGVTDYASCLKAYPGTDPTSSACQTSDGLKYFKDTSSENY